MTVGKGNNPGQMLLEADEGMISPGNHRLPRARQLVDSLLRVQHLVTGLRQQPITFGVCQP